MASPSGPTGPNEPVSTGKRPITEPVQQEGLEHDQDDSRPRKKARTGSAPSSTHDGVDSTGFSTAPPSASSSDAQDAASTSREVSRSPPASRATALRTSFGGPAPGSKKIANPDLLAHNPLTAQERDDLVCAIQAGEDKELPTYAKQHVDWTINPIKSEWVVGSTWLEIFDSIIDNWSAAFAMENEGNVRQVGLRPSVIHATFRRRLATSCTPGLPKLFWQVVKKKLMHPEKLQCVMKHCTSPQPGQQAPAETPAAMPAEASAAAEEDSNETTKELSKAARRKKRKEQQRKKHQELAASKESANEQSASAHSSPPDEGANIVLATEQDEQTTAPVSVKGTNDAVVDEPEHAQDTAAVSDSELELHSEPPSQAELDQRHLYYPGLPDDAIFCLACAQTGHSTTSCPETSCKFCKDVHFKYECPTRQRCTNCKQSGHTKASCTEKLAVAPGEVATECAFCEGCDHTEYNCSSLWQIYRPTPGQVKKVKSLPTFCYCCGYDGHYGGDCTMVSKRVPPTKTWTLSAAAIYVDAASSEIALAYRNPLPPPSVVTKPVIPGRSIKPQSHVFYEESDDENQADGFVRSATSGSGSKPIGKISIASNINFGGASAMGGEALQKNGQQQQQNNHNNNRYPQRNRNPWPEPPQRPPPPPGAKQYPQRNRSNAHKSKSGPSQHQQGGGGGRGGGRGGSNRGRGGFSSFSKRGRSRGRGN
ncbi:hypothetical protein BD289DRAFT_480344 [Coniella lustricola]|uniref:CCHC-type domain-containing protein n=1 Tax=Coniella lustricola TaxID=2025994 RepID=A0A2T3AFT2_9PEZI|nr:hypothetical protein BD289DRAFT_480344 [Coniella lustricola]